MSKVCTILLAGFLAMMAMLTMAGCRSAHTTSAILYIDEKNYDKAVQVLHEGFEYRDDEPDAFYYLGEAHSRLAEEAISENNYSEARKNYELAYQSFLRSKELDPENWTEDANQEMQYNYINRKNDAIEEQNIGNFEEAEGFYRLAYAALPDSVSVIKNLARMKIVMAQPLVSEEQKEQRVALLNESLELLSQVLEVNSDAYELQADKAAVLVQLERPDEAAAIYGELMKNHGDDPALLIDIANLSMEQKEYEKAADLYVRASELFEADPDHTDETVIMELEKQAAMTLATEEIHRYDDAQALLDRASQRETLPSEEIFRLRLQTAYDHGNWLKEQAAATEDPVQKAAFELKSQEQFSKGVDIGNALVQSFPSYALGYYLLALCQLELGDHAAAESNLQQYNQLTQTEIQ